MAVGRRRRNRLGLTSRLLLRRVGPFALGDWRLLISPAAVPRAMQLGLVLVAAVVSLVVGLPSSAASSDQPVGEVVEMRTQSSDTYRNEDGSFQTVVSSVPVNFKDLDESWQPIASALVPSTRFGFALENVANKFHARFTASPALAGGVLAEFAPSEATSFALSLPDVQIGSTMLPEGDNGVVYTGALRGADLHYRVTATGVKEGIELADASAPTTFTFKLVPKDGDQYEARANPDGSWKLNAKGEPEPLFVFPRPSVSDSSATAELDGRKWPIAPGPDKAVSLAVESLKDGSFQLTLALDPGWLKDPSRVFPVLIDPDVTIAPDSRDAIFNSVCSTCTPTVGSTINVAGNSQSSALQFDLGQIPAGNITSASVSLFWWNCYPLNCGWFWGNGQAGDIGLFRLTSPWGMSTTTGQISYATPYLSNRHFDVWSGGQQPGSYYSWNVPATTIQDWLSGAQPNYGFWLAPTNYTTQFNFIGSGWGSTTSAPTLTISWSGDASRLYQPSVVRSNGAELNWDPFPAATGANFLRYEVHRSTTPGFTPSPSTLVATLADKAVSRYVDATAAPNASFTYKLVTITDSTTSPSNPSNEVTVTTPPDGQAQAVFQPDPTAAKATYLNAGAASTNYGSSGALFVQGSSAKLRSLVKFDLRQIPTGTQVSSATLSLYSTLTYNSPGTIEVHRVTADWDENAASWNNRLSGVPWTTAGGDYDAAVAGSGSAATSTGWENYSLSSLVQSWLDGSNSNNGVLLRLADETPNSYDQWNSDELANGRSLTPKLTVVYTDNSHALAPAVAMGAPGDSSTISGSAVSLTAAASDDGSVTKVEFWRDSETTPISTDTQAPWASTLDSTTLVRGSHTLYAKAYDNGGNVSTSATISVSVANSTVPTVGAPSVSGSGAVKAVSATASDDRSISKVVFYANGDRIGTATTPNGSTYSINWNTGATVPGSPSSLWSADTLTGVQTPSGSGAGPALTGSGNELTDASRAGNTQGDGLAAPDSSFGIWETTTNKVKNGGLETNTSNWLQFVGTETLTRDTTRAKFGAASLKTVTGAASGQGAQTTSVTTTASQTYTASAWVYGTSGTVKLGLSERDSSDNQVLGGETDSAALTLNGSWQRLTVKRTFGATGVKARLLMITTAAQVTTFWMDGAQIENAFVATPYVETNGASATRSAARVQEPANLLSTGSGWVVLRVRGEWGSASTNAPGNGTGTEWLFDWRTDTNNRYSLFWAESATKFKFVRLLGGVTKTAAAASQTLIAGDPHTLIASWVDGSSISISVDGGPFTTTSLAGTGNFSPAGGSFDIGSDGSASLWDGEIAWVATGTGTLSDADAASINALGSTDPPLARVYDSSSYSLTAKAFDDDGQITVSTPTNNVSVANTNGTKYQVGLTTGTNAVPQEMSYDPAAQSQTSWPVNVTVTNNASTTLLASQTVLRYRWYTADDTPVVSTSSDVPLGGDITSGSNRTVAVSVLPPTLATGVYRARYRLQIDLYDSSAGVYFAAKGNKPFEQNVTVNLTTPLQLGLERFHYYDRQPLGGGLTNIVNLANGNTIVSWTPLAEPGRGLNTVLTVTYNSLAQGSESPVGNNWSLAISSLTPFGLPLDIHPNASDTLAGRTARWVGFTDGDGSYHVFTAAGTSGYAAPPGVHLYLRGGGSGDTTWALTKPDRTSFYYNAAGYPTQDQDGRTNTLSQHETTVAAGDDAYGLAQHVDQITDAGGRNFSVSYYTKADTGLPALRGKVKSLSDHLTSTDARTLRFDYYNDGNLMRITQAGGQNPDGSWLADRSVLFTYTTLDGSGPAIPTATGRLNPDPGTQQGTKLYSAIDFRVNETTFSYSSSGLTQGALTAWTDRTGKQTSFAYTPASSTTTESKPLARTWSYSFDSAGRVTSITDPVDSQPTTVSWTTDNAVSRVTEPSGRHLDYRYNANGYLTDRWDGGRRPHQPELPERPGRHRRHLN